MNPSLPSVHTQTQTAFGPIIWLESRWYGNYARRRMTYGKIADLWPSIWTESFTRSYPDLRREETARDSTRKWESFVKLSQAFSFSLKIRAGPASRVQGNALRLMLYLN